LVEVPILCFDGDVAGQRAAMRAVTRALPLLRPGHSLSIVRLPAGMDPDDLVKRDGKEAMERLLAAPSSLIDTLWEYERNAQPLKTPEDKAGLKARLLERTEAIQHPDIRSLYRSELLARFSAFAYPPRPPRDRNWRAGRPEPSRISPESAGRLQRSSSGGARDTLTQAVIAGLARHPGEIHRHAEALGKLAPRDAATGRAIDSLLDAADTLEMGGESPIFAFDSFAPPPDSTCFSFLMEGSDPQGAREDLAEAVTLLVERPALEAALADATVRFEQTFEQEAFDEQQRLLKRKLEFERRLGQMASKRAATKAQETASSGAPQEALDEPKLD
jgi:DNA primase